VVTGTLTTTSTRTSGIPAGTRVERALHYRSPDEDAPPRMIIQRGTVLAPRTPYGDPLLWVQWDGEWRPFAAPPETVRPVQDDDLAAERARHQHAVGDVVTAVRFGVRQCGIVLEAATHHGAWRLRVYWPRTAQEAWHRPDELAPAA